MPLNQDLSSSIKTVRVKDLIVHPDVSMEFRKAWASTIYLLEGGRSLPKDAILFLLYLHPPLACAIGKKRKQYACIAGLRSLQLAKSCLPPAQEIRILDFEDGGNNNFSDFAQLDFYLTSVIMGLDFQVWRSKEMPKPWQHLLCNSSTNSLWTHSEKCSKLMLALPKIGRQKIVSVPAREIKAPSHNSLALSCKMTRYLQDLKISPVATKIFSNCHPPHVVKMSEEGQYRCFANGRSLYLQQSLKETSEHVNVCLHSRLAKQNFTELETCSQAITPLFFALGGGVWKHDILRIWQLAGKVLKHNDLAKGLRSKSALGRTLSVNRNTILPEIEHPKSRLQQFAQQALGV